MVFIARTAPNVSPAGGTPRLRIVWLLQKMQSRISSGGLVAPKILSGIVFQHGMSVAPRARSSRPSTSL